MLIKFDADIISGISIGNIHLGKNISFYLENMYLNYEVLVKEYFLPNDEKRIVYLINNILSVSTLTDGIIISIGCNQNYLGSYKKILYAGQTMVEIKQMTNNQKILNGALIINNDIGLHFIIPSPYDELADSIDQIPDGVVFNQIYVE